MTRILAIHGIGNYQNCASKEAETKLAVCYRGAVAKGFTKWSSNYVPDVDLQAVYYSDLLRLSGEQDSTVGDLAGPNEAEILLAWASEFGVRVPAIQGAATVPIRVVAEAVARVLGKDSDAGYTRKLALTLSNFVRDVSRYFNYPARRNAVRSYVAAAIDFFEPDVVIGHSLGSVVAYEAFHDIEAGTVSTFITVGSPLALPGAIFDRLSPSPNRMSRSREGTFPSGVVQWHNYVDVGDIIAIPRPLSRYFDDLDAARDREVSIGFVRSHSFSAYLSSKELSRFLAKCARGR